MRNISFALTWDRLLGGSKTVTRRLGWAGLKPGTLLMAYRKSQGEARDRVERFGPILVVSVRRERLDAGRRKGTERILNGAKKGDGEERGRNEY